MQVNAVLDGPARWDPAIPVQAMVATPAEILAILDRCSGENTFPMLDNGYVYLAATRLGLYRSSEDWAMVIEVFGFSPRSGLPDLHIYTFASNLHERDKPESYVSRSAFDNYLARHPNDDSRFVFPVEGGPWQDEEDGELVAPDASEAIVRGQPCPMPQMGEYEKSGVSLEAPPRVRFFAWCRWLAERRREAVLGTPAERRISTLPEMKELLLLNEWRHPDLLGGELPSHLSSFQQFAKVLAAGDPGLYQPNDEPNTHWRHWPEGGTL